MHLIIAIYYFHVRSETVSEIRLAPPLFPQSRVLQIVISGFQERSRPGLPPLTLPGLVLRDCALSV